MKKLFKILLQYYLKAIVKIILLVHRPAVIAVAGSVNKSFFRDEIKKVLLAKGKTVRANPKNFNTEIGLPLAILNIESGYNSYQRWLPAIGKAFLAIFQKDFPQYLVLELGVAQKEDMKYLLSLVKSKIAVVTEITQRYIESFSGMERLVGEYIYLAKNLKKDDTLILNWDNSKVRELKKYTKAKVIYFGKNNSACDGEIKNIAEEKWGMKVDLRYQKEEKEMEIKRFGEHHAAAALAGWIVKKEI